MTAQVRPRRSILYMPASNPRALEKARSLPADGFIFDLEDAVAPAAKDEARDLLAQVLSTGGYGQRELFVRVNPLSSQWGPADLAKAAHLPVHAVLLPKVESAAAIHAAEKALAAADAHERLWIWCMIETPRGVLRVEEIASASQRVAGLVMGTSDLVKDLHARHTSDRMPLLTALSQCVLAARAYGLAILDGVHLDLADDAGFEAVCRQARALGFDGKTLIHPKTIAAANTAFGPASEDITQARRIITAHEEAAASSKGVVLVDGQLIENLHVAMARELIEIADAIERLESAQAS